MSIALLLRFDLPQVGFAAVFLLGIVLLKARPTFIKILNRSRWLLLSLLVLFLWATPGVYPNNLLAILGITTEGLDEALTHGARLLAILAMLALLLERLNHQQLISGLYTLMKPLARWGDARRMIAVRLMLTLEFAAEGEREEWRGLTSSASTKALARTIELFTPPWRGIDSVFVGLVGMVGVMQWILP